MRLMYNMMVNAVELGMIQAVDAATLNSAVQCVRTIVVCGCTSQSRARKHASFGGL